MTMDETNPYEAFEKAVERQLGDALKESEDMCVELWSSLANVEWHHPENHWAVMYSFRAAGGMIAEVIGKGNYMDWYCSGPYAVVSDRVARALKKEGWIYDDVGPICDVPGCIEPAGCGWPSPDGYRSTCGPHMRKLDSSLSTENTSE